MTTIIEVPAGSIDGANKTFTTSKAYAPGTLHVFLNGQLKRADLDDGFIEVNPATGVFEMKEAPLTGDVVQVFYIDEASLGAGGEDFPTLVIGVVESDKALEGDFTAVGSLASVLVVEDGLDSTLKIEEGLDSMLSGLDSLTGTIKICDL